VTAKRIGLGEGESMEEGEIGDRRPVNGGLVEALYQESGIPEGLEEARSRFGLNDEAMAFLLNMGKRATENTVRRMEVEMKKQLKKEVKEELAKEAEADKCKRSMVLLNPGPWVEQERATYGFSMAERVTAAIHKATLGMVAVTDAFQIGQGRQGGPPPAVHVTFASTGQKGSWFRVLAAMNKVGGQAAERARAISCRDSFPKEFLGEVRNLVATGMSLKREGKVAGFRVRAQGPACIPVLETRERSHRGPGGWRTFQPTAMEEAAEHYVESVEKEWDHMSPE
jgi:hypothetical protein